MKSTARLVAALVVALTLPTFAPLARAEDPVTTTVAEPAARRLIAPQQNPYAQKLSAALVAYRVAYNRLYKEYQAYPWDHARLYRNYNAAWAAYRQYVSVKQKHDEWERLHQGRFHGDVVTRLWYRKEMMPLSERPSADAAAMIARPDFVPTQPVAGATVRVVRNIYYIQGGANIMPPQDEWSMTATTDAKGRFEIRPLAQGSYRYTVEKAGFESAYGTFEIGQGIASSTRIQLESRRQLAGRIWTVSPIAMPLVQHILSRKIAMSVVSEEISEEIRETLASNGASIPGQRPLLIPVSGAHITLTPTYNVMPMRATDAAAGIEPAASSAAAPTTDDLASADPAVARCIAPYPTLTATTDASGRYTFADLNDGAYSISVTHPGHHVFSARIDLDAGQNVRDIILIPSMWDRAQPMVESAGFDASETTASANGSVDDPFGAE